MVKGKVGSASSRNSNLKENNWMIRNAFFYILSLYCQFTASRPIFGIEQVIFTSLANLCLDSPTALPHSLVARVTLAAFALRVLGVIVPLSLVARLG